MFARIARKARRILHEQSRFFRDCIAPSYLPVSPWRPGWTPYIGLGRIANLFCVELATDEAARLNFIADKAVVHEFDLLGSGWRPVEADRADRVNRANTAETTRIRQMLPPDYVPIDWQRDFKAGHRWSEKMWYQRIPIGHVRGADVKVPWELGRLQHLPCLAFAFASANRRGSACRPVYAAEFRNQVLDFMAANPPRWGVQWRCTMDVAIRVANMIVAFDLFRFAGARWDDGFLGLFWRSVVEHAVHIWNNLEWHSLFRGNHYLCDLVGLLCAAAYLPASSATREWLTFAVREFGNELAFQFNLDGGNFEASTFYHRLSAEAVLFAAALIESLPGEHRPSSPLWQREQVERRRRFSELAKSFRVGDNDSGRIFNIQLGGSAGHSDPCLRGGLSGIEETWQCDAFPLFGLYVYSSTRVRLSIRCGPVGQNGNGGHAHNDQLSFELIADGLPFIIDPGTFVYTPLPEERNKYRSTAMHNTLTVDGREQNAWRPGLRGLFQLHDQCRARELSLGKSHFVGMHHGFGAPHRRTIDLFRGQIRGIDECSAPTKKYIHFHLAPEVQLEVREAGRAVRLANGETLLALRSDSGRLSVHETVYAPAYGVQVPSREIMLESAEPVIGWTIEIPWERKV